MSRKCIKCGLTVIVGQGKWTGEKGKPETMRLSHISSALCEKAQSHGEGVRERLAEARNAKAKARQSQCQA
jgi:hypothetical protein